jgi:galactokinase
MNIVEIVEKKFREIYKEEPLLVRSPGRVNLIGEHTDYNMGFVLPGAIDKAIYFAVSPRKDNICCVFAVDLNDSYEFRIDNIQHSKKGWANYLIGIVDQLSKAGYQVTGFNCAFGGDIPIGAGLSSSAAVEAGLAFALNHIFNFEIEKLSLVKLAQKSENEFVGVKCGIMDQYINIFGKCKNVLRIDCRSLEYEYFPFDFNDVSVVLFNSNVSHSLASSEYNRRRAECNQGVEIIKKVYPQVESLRDVSKEMLSELKSKLSAIIYKRCKYVVEENDRVLKACASLKKGDLKEFGSLMNDTHSGLSKDYEVSCKELDYLVQLTWNNPKVYGSRMMGGGFGGCTINLIENDAVEHIGKSICYSYEKIFSVMPEIYITTISGGTNIISVNENAAV